MKLIKRILLIDFPCIAAAIFIANVGEAVIYCRGKPEEYRLLYFLDYLPAAFEDLRPIAARECLFAGITAFILLRLMFLLIGNNAGKKSRRGEEYGTARWGVKKDIRPFEDKDSRNNVILTKTEALTMNSRPGRPEYARNKNVLVVGGSGSGKTRFFIKPNLLQCDSLKYPVSFVVTDPKSELFRSCGRMLKEKGYDVKVFNTLDFSRSYHYNPFEYLNSQSDILKLVTALISNTRGQGTSADPFWEKAESLLYTALISYIHYECPKDKQNFGELLNLLNEIAVPIDKDGGTKADQYFFELEERNPTHIAVLQYRKFKQSAADTLKSIMISCAARLAPFEIEEVKEILSFDELGLDRIGDRKTALFLIMSDNDPTFNFLISMIYTQLFNRLCERADNLPGGRLPVHVRCLIDEAANVGQIPHLEKLIATIRSREISACLVLQAKSQLRAIYKENTDTIIGNMDTQLFLGGTEPGTLKDLSEALGRETIDAWSTSDTKGVSASHGHNYQKMGRELMSRDEIAVMNGRKCILQLRGVRPFLSDKYDYTKHPNYRLTADADPGRTYVFDRKRANRLVLRANDQYTLVCV